MIQLQESFFLQLLLIVRLKIFWKSHKNMDGLASVTTKSIGNTYDAYETASA